MQAEELYYIGQLVEHKLYGYRGVIVDVDPHFKQSDKWYDETATNKPAKNKPWYHVLVHNAGYITYVAEENLDLSKVGEQIHHPDLGKYFSHFINGQYQCLRMN